MTENIFRCDVCSQRFYQRRHLSSHINRIHGRSTDAFTDIGNSKLHTICKSADDEWEMDNIYNVLVGFEPSFQPNENFSTVCYKVFDFDQNFEDKNSLFTNEALKLYLIGAAYPTMSTKA